MLGSLLVRPNGTAVAPTDMRHLRYSHGAVGFSRDRPSGVCQMAIDAFAVHDETISRLDTQHRKKIDSLNFVGEITGIALVPQDRRGFVSGWRVDPNWQPISSRTSCCP